MMPDDPEEQLALALTLALEVVLRLVLSAMRGAEGKEGMSDGLEMHRNGS